jgi:hypothetical protein
MHEGAYAVALKGLDHDFGRAGGAKRRLPVGGSANGIPRNLLTSTGTDGRDVTVPTTIPASMVADGAVGAEKTDAQRRRLAKTTLAKYAMMAFTQVSPSTSTRLTNKQRRTRNGSSKLTSRQTINCSLGLPQKGCRNQIKSKSKPSTHLHRSQTLPRRSWRQIVRLQLLSCAQLTSRGLASSQLKSVACIRERDTPSLFETWMFFHRQGYHHYRQCCSSFLTPILSNIGST